MESASKLFGFLKTIIFVSLAQFVSLLAVFLFFGFILYFLARFTRQTFVKSIGPKFDMYITAWIGTPIHELGHAIFCVIFGHKITAIKLFSPNSQNGTLGYVNHSYNTRNPWHRIGDFFIGFGPIILGSLIIFLLSWVLLPTHNTLIDSSLNQAFQISSGSDILKQASILFAGGKHVFSHLFSTDNLASWQFWIFIYISMSIASHMELSPPDLKSVWGGSLYIFTLLLIINTIAFAFKIDLNNYINFISRSINITSQIFTFSAIISAIFFTISFIILNIYSMIFHRKLFHPFG